MISSAIYLKSWSEVLGALYSNFTSGVLVTLFILFVIVGIPFIIYVAHSTRNHVLWDPFSEDIEVNVHITIEDDDEEE